MLDDLKRMGALDQSDMLGTMSSYPSFIEFGCKRATELKLRARAPEGLVYLGLGGSAIGGDVIRDWLGQEIPGGVRVERGYELSAQVGKDSLVICCSYSGNTVETLSMLAKIPSSHKDRLILISSDGKLSEMSKKKKLPFIRLPKGIQPRASLPAVISAVATVCDGVGWTRGSKSSMIAASKSGRSLIRNRLRPEVPETVNIAKQMAHQVHGSIPVSLTTVGMESVARRWKTQMNENAKQHCFFGTFPEVSHNEIVPWLRDERSGMLVALMLHDPFAPPKLRKAFEKYRDTLKENVKLIDIQVTGKSKIEAMINHLLMADFTSAYSGLLSGVDPSPVVEIMDFKKK